MSRWTAWRPARRPEWLQVDPYYEWALATNFAYYGQAEWLPLLLELRNAPKLPGTAQAFAELVFKLQSLEAERRSWAANLRVPAFYAGPMPRMKSPTNVIALLANRAFLAGICVGQEPADSIQRFELGRATESPDSLL